MKFTGAYTYSNNKALNLHLFQAIALSLVLKDGKHEYFEFGQEPYHVRVAEISSAGFFCRFG